MKYIVKSLYYQNATEKAENRTTVRFLRFLSFARGQYRCTAPARKIQNPTRLFDSLSACRAVQFVASTPFLTR